MSNVVKTSLLRPLDNETVYESQFVYKGEYIVGIDVGGISERDALALNITIDWGDGSEREVYRRDVVYNYREKSILPEVQDGRIGGSILGTYEHRYEPTTTHIRELSAQILINFADGKYTKIVQPIALVMESYYDNIQEFLINSISIHDDTLFSIINLQSKYNNRAWPAVWVDNNILTTSVIPPDRPVDPPPVDPCPYFNCSGNPDHPNIDCPEGYSFNCNTCRCERVFPPDKPPCVPYSIDPSYPCYPNYPNYPSYPSYCKYPPLCYEIDKTYGDNNNLITDPFGFNQVVINPDT